MAAVAIDASRAADPGQRGPVPARTAGPAAADRSPAAARPGRTVRSWPLLVLAAPAAAEVWSGWVGIAQKTGFGLVSPLPGIWPSLHLDTAITLPVGVEAYAAYALRAWLAREHSISDRTRRFAKWSAIFSFALGMAGQVAYHLMAQAGMARAPWAVTTIVSCLPVLVLGMGTALAHMLRADAERRWMHRTAGPGPVSRPRSLARSPRGPGRTGRTAGRRDRREAGTRSLQPGPERRSGITRPGGRQPPPGGSGPRGCPEAGRGGEAGVTASVAQRGVTGSNEALNALARMFSAELAGAAALPARPGNAVV